MWLEKYGLFGLFCNYVLFKLVPCLDLSSIILRNAFPGIKAVMGSVIKQIIKALEMEKCITDGNLGQIVISLLPCWNLCQTPPTPLLQPAIPGILRESNNESLCGSCL